MRALKTAAVVLMLTVRCFTGRAQSANEAFSSNGLAADYSLKLEFKPDAVKLGEGGVGKLILTNTTNHDI